METTKINIYYFLQLENFLKKIYDFLEKLVSDQYWAIKSTCLATIISLFFATPNFPTLRNSLSQGRGAQVSMQIQDLVGAWQTYNGENTVYRITMPIIARLLHLDILGTYILQFLCGIALFYFVARIVERETQDRVLSLLVTIATAGIFAGSTSFVEARAMYDGVAIFLLVLSMWVRSPLAIISFVYMASFTDERAIVSAGFIFLYWFFSYSKWKFEIKKLINPQSMAVIAAIVAHFITRIILKQTYGLVTWTEKKAEFLLFDQVNNIPMGLWTAFETAWIFILLASLWLAHNKRWLFLSLLWGVISVQSLIAFSIVDITRSLAYLFPALLLSLSILSKVKINQLRNIALVVAIINVLTLNYGAGGKSSIWLFYPLPIQLIRWLIGA